MAKASGGPSTATCSACSLPPAYFRRPWRTGHMIPTSCCGACTMARARDSGPRASDNVSLRRGSQLFDFCDQAVDVFVGDVLAVVGELEADAIALGFGDQDLRDGAGDCVEVDREAADELADLRAARRQQIESVAALRHLGATRSE